MQLPNLEDPQDLLTPERLVVGRPEDWHRQPLPQGFGWFDIASYPRCAFAGALPLFPPPDQVKEVALGYLPPDHVSRLKNARLDSVLDFRLLNGASPGLIFPFLRGDEMVKVTGMRPEGECIFRLPGDRPSVGIRFHGKDLSATIVPHTVCVLMEERLISVLWRASARTPEGFRQKLPTKENLEPDPLEDLQISVG